MRFSTFLNGRATNPDQDRFLIEASIAHAQLAEDLGLAAVFQPDHHFTGYTPWASDSFMLAAYLAATLKKIHFGFSVVSVPLHHPIRLVERINLLDQLTQGRLLVGVGSGTTPEEMIGFGVNYKDASAISNKNLEIAERLWSKQMDDPAIEIDNGPFKGALLQRIAPAPYSKGHAKLMPVAMKEASARRAAESGWPAFIPAFTPPQIGGTDPFSHVKKYFTVYRDLLEAAGHPDEVVADALSWSTHTYQCVHLAESDEQARDELMEILTAYQQALDREAEFNDRAEATPGNRKTDLVPNALSEDWIGTWVLYGSPKTVIEHLEPYAELGIGNILCGFQAGPLTQRRAQLADGAMRLLAEQVMPRFATPPEWVRT
jgi:alkanesulfonate monooxygenase SsuD/methylene tetrahydromethanopterin reductase-like flavin-dependent oxidoreductase (luciferase family)